MTKIFMIRVCVFRGDKAGWGSYDKRYEKMPYWGMRGGDLMAAQRQECLLN
jgi:hypothetical protein